MFRTTQLGKILNEHDKRDAVHIAVAPMFCDDDKLKPGQHVGISRGDDFASKSVSKCIGIVDPFLTEPVLKGQKFWLFLYPNTITSLRHDWSHPAFETDVARSKEWLEHFADRCNLVYNVVMDGAKTWISYEEYTYENTESYKDLTEQDWNEFWKHYEIVTGEKVPNDKKASFFTCSC